MARAIKAAVVGLGRSGYSIHVRRMKDDERFRVTAIADWLPERAAEVADEVGCAVYPDYQALLRDADADVVVVASYSDTHPEIAKAALRSGRHAICEKPMADSLPAARSMVQAAEKSGKKLLVHHNNRFARDVRHILDVIRTKRIGDVFEIRMRALGFSRRNDWQTLRKYAGGVLNNTGSHYIDAGLQFLASPVRDVFCDLKLISDVGDAEDHVKVLLRAENGRVYDMEVSTSCRTSEPKWTVLGSCGTLVSDGKTSKIEWFDSKKLAKLRPIETPPLRRYGNDDVIPWQSEEVPSVGPSIGDFYDNVWAVLRERKKMVVTPEQAVEVVRISDACRRRGGS